MMRLNRFRLGLTWALTFFALAVGVAIGAVFAHAPEDLVTRSRLHALYAFGLLCRSLRAAVRDWIFGHPEDPFYQDR